eukprot:TRINITY_DN71435_c0_g1_i1.p1 TRINITY_DN71435_c0_g1~~TRINITY_DN71435_c0_g1_i1.p1  ORF type:complete len:255 (+),score=68.01 TRINITY_DN71435_c0_g1_i1:71-835(+)
MRAPLARASGALLRTGRDAASAQSRCAAAAPSPDPALSQKFQSDMAAELQRLAANVAQLQAKCAQAGRPAAHSAEDEDRITLDTPLQDVPVKLRSRVEKVGAEATNRVMDRLRDAPDLLKKKRAEVEASEAWRNRDAKLAYLTYAKKVREMEKSAEGERRLVMLDLAMVGALLFLCFWQWRQSRKTRAAVAEKVGEVGQQISGLESSLKGAFETLREDFLAKDEEVREIAARGVQQTKTIDQLVDTLAQRAERR